MLPDSDEAQDEAGGAAHQRRGARAEPHSASDDENGGADDRRSRPPNRFSSNHGAPRRRADAFYELNKPHKLNSESNKVNLAERP